MAHPDVRRAVEDLGAITRYAGAPSEDVGAVTRRADQEEMASG